MGGKRGNIHTWFIFLFWLVKVKVGQFFQMIPKWSILDRTMIFSVAPTMWQLHCLSWSCQGHQGTYNDLPLQTWMIKIQNWRCITLTTVGPNGHFRDIGVFEVRLRSLRYHWSRLCEDITNSKFHTLSHTSSHTFTHFTHTFHTLWATLANFKQF